MIGQQVGTYKIVEKLSEGGMGAVYKAVDMMLDREVAIKVLKPELARQTTVVERFRLEAITLAKLNHPNIATLHSFFRQGDELFMILEYVRGETVDKVLQRRGGPLSCEEAIPIFTELLSCVAHAHEFGVIHRDIKPANLMLTEKGTLKVLDFGIARLRGSARITKAGNIIGTLEYMSPEQTRGLETDARSDIYSLGMTLFEILTGKTPFDTDNEFELIQKQVGEIPPAPRTINPQIPPAIEAAIIKAYAKNPEERFQTAGEFREALLKEGFSSAAARETAGDLPEKTTDRHLSLGVSKPFIPEMTLLVAGAGAVAMVSPETTTVEIAGEDLPESGEATVFDNSGSDINDDSRSGLNKALPAQDSSSLVEADPIENDESQIKSFSNKPRRWKSVAGSAAALSILLSLLIGSALYFSKDTEPAPSGFENKAGIEPKAEAAEKKPDTAANPAATNTAKPVERETTTTRFTTRSSQPKTSSQIKSRVDLPRLPAKKAALPRLPTRKKEFRNSAAENIRRAERLLTGN